MSARMIISYDSLMGAGLETNAGKNPEANRPQKRARGIQTASPPDNFPLEVISLNRFNSQNILGSLKIRRQTQENVLKWLPSLLTLRPRFSRKNSLKPSFPSSGTSPVSRPCDYRAPESRMGSSAAKPSGCSVWRLCTRSQQEGRKPIVGHCYVSVYTLNSLDSEVFIQRSSSYSLPHL